MRIRSGVVRRLGVLVGAWGAVATLSCRDATTTVVPGPTLGTSFDLTALDGRPLPLAVTTRFQQTTKPTNLISGTLALDDFTAAWTLSIRDDTATIENILSIVGSFRHRVMSRDSVEITMGPSTVVFAGHFDETVLMLMPVTGADATAPITDFVAHSWTFRVSAPSSP